MNLQTIGHSFAGLIKNKIVMGYKKHGTFASELSIIENDQKILSEFKLDSERKFRGELVQSENGSIKKHSIEYVGFDKDAAKFSFKFDNVLQHIYVTADAFENNHFINPRYEMEYLGETVYFQLNDGQACPGYSMHLISMIMPTIIF